MPNLTCTHCNRAIRRFTITNDWNTRPLHKKCWKFLEEERKWELEKTRDQYLAENRNLGELNDKIYLIEVNNGIDRKHV